MSTPHNFNLNTQGSKLSYLTSGNIPGNIGQIHYLKGGSIIGAHQFNKQGSANPLQSNNTALSGIVIPLGMGGLAGEPYSDSTLKNQIGDPNEKSYTLTADDIVGSDGHEKDGSAQKFINAVLDGAFVAYDSGVKQGSGLSSMTVSRGDLTLNSSKVTGISGVVNKYSRSYSVSFSYTQSGNITVGNNGNVAAQPDISNDLASQVSDGDRPF